jgi:hypothetical protein
LSAVRLRALAGVSRATYYRFDPERVPAVRDVELRDQIQRIALKHRMRMSKPSSCKGNFMIV